MFQQHLYRQQLFNTMKKDDELVDTVKLHLRQKIISKLKSTPSTPSVPTDQTLVKKLCCSLFIDYLNTYNYLHTASVFAPQSNSSRNQFSKQQLCSLMRVQILENGSILQGVLNQVLPKGRLHEKRTSTAAQTDDRESIQDLERKLGNIQHQYKQKINSGIKSVEQSQQRFLKYKNQLNKRCKQQLQSEIQRIRNFEIANIKIDEQQKYKLKMKQYQQEMQNIYKNKMDKMRQRQATIMKKVSDKMRDVQSYGFETRQRIIKDLQSLRVKQEELQRTKMQLQQRQRLLKTEGQKY